MIPSPALIPPLAGLFPTEILLFRDQMSKKQQRKQVMG
jgi:hypothetical protein